MDIKTKILEIWKKDRKNISSISQGRFKGIVYKNGDSIQIVGISLQDNNVPIAINESIHKDDYATKVNSFIHGEISEEIKDNSFNVFKAMLNKTIGDTFLNQYIIDFETEFNKKTLESPTYINLCKQISNKESDFLIKNILQPFIDNKLIDTEALSIVCNSYLPTEKSYVFYSEKDETKRKLRHQASTSVPVLANLIADKLSLRQTVDNMNPLLPALNQVLGNNSLGQPIMTKSMMKRLNSRILNFHGEDTKAKSIISVLSELPPDWFPSDDKEWDSFLKIHTNIGMNIEGGDRGYDKLYKASAGKWTDFMNSIVLAWRDIRPPEGATKADMEYLEKALDIKLLTKMAKEYKFEEIRASSKAISESIPLPSNITPQSLEQWINTMFAPDNSEKTIVGIGNAINDISEALRKRIVMPLVAYSTNLKTAIPNRKTEEMSLDVAKSMIFDGRSLTDGIEILRKIKSQYGSLVMAPIETVIAPTVEKKSDKGKDSGYIAEDRVQIMKDFMGYPGEDQEWSPLVQAFIAPNGVACIPLINKELLSYEGEFMNHCVGDYHVTQCVNGTERIFSLRRKNNDGELTTLATMAVIFRNNQAKVSCVLGYSNTSSVSPATQAPVDMMKQYLSQINTKGPAYLKSLLGKSNSHMSDSFDNAQRDEIRKNMIEADAGYSWNKRENLEKAMSSWGQFISKPWRKKPDDIFTAPVIIETAKTINPSLQVKKTPSLKTPAL